jgi:hypothetical protein
VQSKCFCWTRRGQHFVACFFEERAEHVPDAVVILDQ